MKACTFFLILLLPFGLFASDWKMEIRGAYFHPSCKKVRETYSNGWIDFQVETAKQVHDYLEVWAGVNWMSKKGHINEYSLGFKERTKAFILPLSLGVKLIYPLTCAMDIYLGAGACYSFLKIKKEYEYFDYSSYDSSYDSSSFSKKSLHKSNAGGVFKAGFQYTIGKECFLDFFADYFLQHFHFSNHTEKRRFNASGFKFGAGFGVYF